MASSENKSAIQDGKEQKEVLPEATIGVSAEPKAPSRKLAKPFLLGLGGIIILLVLGLLIKIVIFPPTFKAITYDNGQGSKLQLQFYRKYYLSNDYSSTAPASVNKPANASSLTGLASKVPVDNKYPLWIGVTVNALNNYARAQYAANGNQFSCGPGATILTVNNTWFKQRIPICKFDLIIDRPAYSGSFIYKQKLYSIIITQVATKQQLANKNGPESTGLADYQTDIKTIINSIKPD